MGEITEASAEMEKGQLQKACIEVQKLSLESQSNDVTNTAGKKLKGIPASTKTKSQNFSFTVQFNPSELRISGREGEQVKKSDIQKSGEEKYGEPVIYETVKPQANLSLKLIFDQSDNPDQGAARQTEGFLAAVRSPATRNISFDWNDFHFSGILGSVSVQYTMFSNYGVPLRSAVSLEIVKR